MKDLQAKKQNMIFYPSAIFDTDQKFYSFFDNLLAQTNYISINPNTSLYIGANEMMKKKVLNDFLCEARRRLGQMK